MITATMGIITILSCYVIAVATEHVPGWLPMISDCAVQSPEKYIFRIGMVVTACLLFCNTYLYFFYIGFAEFGKVRLSDDISKFCGFTSCFALAMLASISEVDDLYVHDSMYYEKNIASIVSSTTNKK
jgi:alpha-L-fucosidase